MRKLVIAPNKKQYDSFVSKERNKLAEGAKPENYCFVSNPNMLNGYRGELIIVNASQITGDWLLQLAELHDDKMQPVRYVTLP